ncbi:transcriptional regulator, AraC family [Sphingobium chlorophenolicum L-1]|uniref:Transcriptional regulator, AraC family n=1 Tax=Sphingobium chlorophenolicum L-1 TaxID=690566 RepID=F6F1Q6_SPHCR|nr:AraC family transcriptional regulator [Sphingobium chlorophenolicum]AEG51472.1 transcriptional regulator, AraC family [Sphingobium chlorophenolicum L-1]
MDPLSDIIALLRPTAAISKPISARGNWCVSYRAYDAPGFTIVLAGGCWLKLADGEPIRLSQGDFILLPTTPAFTLFNKPGVPCIPVEPTAAPVRHGEMEGEPDYAALGGSFRFERVNAPLLLSLLPGMIHIPASEGRGTRFGHIIALFAEECATDYPGREAILQRLIELLLIEALRWRSLKREGMSAGLLHALRDPALARALRAMHADMRARWTIAGLARIAGMSRSTFAARFAEALGCGAIEYLARWRMAFARDALMRGDKSLDRIADEVGYESASAFSTAFRKRSGMAPGRFARLGVEGEAALPRN